jgi:uncharacterized membrane protein
MKLSLQAGKTKGVMGVMRTFVVRGAIFLLPIAVCVFIAKYAVGLVDDYLGDATAALVRWFVPQSWLGAFPEGHVPGMSLVLLLLIMLVLGALASFRIGSRGLRLIDLVILRIPLIGGIYGSTRKIVDTFGDSDRFRRCVLVDTFGGRGLAFVTSESKDQVTGEIWLWVFFPMMPNPTSGILMAVRESDTVPSDISPKDGLKLLMSLGTLMPTAMALSAPSVPPPAVKS